ncbi:MAG: cyclic-phosphate processing receiver domain-containing protein [Candidatus Nanopelagicales bacterium]
MKLWVDDIRKPPGSEWAWALSSSAAIETLSICAVSEMSLDHDLGGEDTTRPVVLWLCEHEDRWPRVVRVHSANPVGRSWLLGMIYHYSPFQGRR